MEDIGLLTHDKIWIDTHHTMGWLWGDDDQLGNLPKACTIHNINHNVSYKLHEASTLMIDFIFVSDFDKTFMIF